MRRRTETPLQRTRRARTLSQAQLAQLIGVSQKTYSQWETGLERPRADVQIQIAAILGADRAVLFSDEAQS